MRLFAPGVEVRDIGPRGLWLLVLGNEYFLPYQDFPWFRDARLGEIHNVRLSHGRYLHWPELDVDLEIESLKSRKKYPLVYQ